jgi:hypothetical protein
MGLFSFELNVEDSEGQETGVIAPENARKKI